MSSSTSNMSKISKTSTTSTTSNTLDFSRSKCECDRCRLEKTNIVMRGGGKKSKNKNHGGVTEENLKDHLYPDVTESPFSDKPEDSPEPVYEDDLPKDYSIVKPIDQRLPAVEDQTKDSKTQISKLQKGGNNSNFKFKSTFTIGHDMFVGRSFSELMYNKAKSDYNDLKKL
jgi:hypothetical protein